jgi:hypothetical protein
MLPFCFVSKSYAILAIAFVLSGYIAIEFTNHTTFTVQDGSKYFGQWSEGQMNGYGNMYFFNNDHYEGDFKDNEAFGNGTYTWKDKSTYKGEWKNNKMHGFGTISYTNRGYYIGEF